MTTGTLTIISLALVIAILLLLVIETVNRKKRSAAYVDNASGTKIFYSARYGISAKPDAIPDPTTIEEFKSRKTGIYASDRIQMMATALAVRSQYPITQGKLITQHASYDVDLSGSDAALFNGIEHEHQLATLVANGIAPPASPSHGKCKSCEFNKSCEYRMRY